MKGERGMKSLFDAIDHIIHLHMCEQEGIEMPTPGEWIEAVERLYNEKKKQASRATESNGVESCKDCGLWGELHKIIKSYPVNYCGNCGRKLNE